MKKIDKRACAKHVDPKHSFNSNNGIFRVPEIAYVVKTCIRNIGRRRMLVLYLYSTADVIRGVIKPVYVVFQAADDFITYDCSPERKEKWRESTLAKILDLVRSKQLIAFYTYADEKRVLSFCKASAEKCDERTGINALLQQQAKIKRHHAKKARDARERKLAASMRRVKPAGKMFQSWANHQVFPKYIVYDYRKGAAAVTGRCSSCGEIVSVQRAKHNQPYICPNCNCEVTLKSSGRSRSIWDRITATKIDRLADDEIIVRVFKLQQVLANGQITRCCYESTRIFVTWDGQGISSVKRYWNSLDRNEAMPWRSGVRPQFSCFQKSYNADPDSYLYTKNLPKVLLGTPWQYSQIDTFFENVRTQLDVQTYLDRYLQYPCIEYLVKLRLYQLARYAVYQYGCEWHDPEQKLGIQLSGHSFPEILGVERTDLSLMQELDISHDQLVLLKAMRRVGIAPSKEFLQWSRQYGISQVALFTVPLRYMSQHKLARYVTEQYEPNKLRPGGFYCGRGYYHARDVLSDYRDYLMMCEGLQCDMTNTFVLFPKDLKAAHKQVENLSTTEKAKLYDYHIASKYEMLSQNYSFSKKGMMIIAPKTATEIVREGQKLHHCVGTYVERMAKDECQIMFLREKSAPDTPFFTIELCNGRIQQVRGSNNDPPPPEVEKFVRLWRKSVLEQPLAQAGFFKETLPQAA